MWSTRLLLKFSGVDWVRRWSISLWTPFLSSSLPIPFSIVLLYVKEKWRESSDHTKDRQAIKATQQTCAFFLMAWCGLWTELFFGLFDGWLSWMVKECVKEHQTFCGLGPKRRHFVGHSPTNATFDSEHKVHNCSYFICIWKGLLTYRLIYSCKSLSAYKLTMVTSWSWKWW